MENKDTKLNKSEKLRLQSMKHYLKQFPENAGKLQDIVKLASQITGIPVAFITLIDEDVQWITVNHGFEVKQMPRATSFCTHTIKQNHVMVVKDTSQDERFVKNPLVCMQPSVKFYAGISLKSAEGFNVGTLCVMDVEPHDLQQDHLYALEALSKQVTNILELNLSIKFLNDSVEQIEGRNKALKEIAQLQSHQIREPLTSIMGLMNLIKEENSISDSNYLHLMEKAVNRLDEKIKSIVQISSKAHAMA